jgi:hypothetical protein
MLNPCRTVGAHSVAGELKGWNRDPFEVHEWRFFSDDGKPTLLVRDGTVRSYDPPPVSGDVRFAQAFEPEPERPRPSTPELVLPTPANRPGSNGHSSSLNGNFGLHFPSERAVARPHDLHPAGDDHPPMPRVLKIAYIVVLAAMAVSGVALAVVHLAGHGSPKHSSASATTTTGSSSNSSSTAASSTTTVALPPALKPSATEAAADLISSWAAGNQSEAQSVATATAVTTLFAGHYSSGLVIDRGCSVQISPTIPVVCTYGPPGGADPTDPIYQLDVLQAPGGWYVSSAKIDN